MAPRSGELGAGHVSFFDQLPAEVDGWAMHWRSAAEAMVSAGRNPGACDANCMHPDHGFVRDMDDIVRSFGRMGLYLLGFGRR